jgi:hypothetical protein
MTETAVQELTKEQKKLHRSIKKETEKSGSTVIQDNEDLRVLYSAGLIGVEAVPGTTTIKVWTMPEGAESVENGENGAATSKESFPIEVGFEYIEPERSVKKADLYPWEKMNLHDSFLVPVTEKRPDPWLKFASTVTSANRRYSHLSDVELVTNSKGKKVAKRIYDRKFALRRVNKGDTYPNGKVELQDGARVYRIL